MIRKYLSSSCRFLVLLPLLSGCTTVKNIVNSPANWDFIQSTGGISVGQPRLVDNIFWLPVNVDFSGNRAITRAPTLMNTGQKCIRAELTQAGGRKEPGYYDLNLQVYSGELDQRQQGGCDEVALFVPSLSPPLARPEQAKFRIWYKDYLLSQHLIGEVTL